MFILGLILYTITLFGVQFSKTYPFLMGWLVLGGISETGRYYVAYVYAIEIFSSEG
jgi:MFS family permease